MARAARVHGRAMILRTRSLAVYILGGAIVLVEGWITGRNPASALVFALAVMATLVCVQLLAVEIFGPRSARKQYRERAALAGAFTVDWDEECLRSTSDRGHSKTAWREMFTFRLGQGLALLYLSSNLYIVLPLRFLNEAQQLDLLERLREARTPGRHRP